MSSQKWRIENFIGEADIKYEEEILKDVNNLSNWIKYYRFKSAMDSCSFENKVFILERGVSQFPRSYKLWITYLELVLENAKSLEYSTNRHEILMMNKLFERSLQMLNKAPVIWCKYLEFLVEKQMCELTFIRNKFNQALYNLPISQHHLIWPLYINFADRVGGCAGASIYARYVQYASIESLQGIEIEGELNISIDLIISKLVDFGSVQVSSQLFQKFVKDAEKAAGFQKSPLKLWFDYMDKLIEYIPDHINLVDNIEKMDDYFENLIEEGLSRFPDQFKFYLKLAEYYKKRGLILKARYIFELSVKKCSSVQDFIMIYDAHTEFEEEILNNLSNDLENDEKNSDLKEDIEFRMNYFEKLIQSRPFLLNDMMLRQDINNLDEWYKRIQLYSDKNNLEKILNTYVQALTTVNPLRAFSASNDAEHTLPKLWIKYTEIYSSRNDFKTANTIFSKSVKSQFQSPDELSEIYVAWIELLFSNDNIDKAIETAENALLSPNDGKDYDYDDKTVDIHLRIHKSIKLWSYYLDLLESLVEKDSQFQEIEKVTQAYDRMIKLKIASPLTIVNLANFLEDWKFYEKSFATYELGLRIFKDADVKYELWNIYITKAILHKWSIERIRDLFDQCLFGTGIENDEGCPANVCKPIYILYSKYEQDYGSSARSIKVLKQGLQKFDDELSSLKFSKIERDKIVNDKYEIYLILLSQIEKMQDYNELRQSYEVSLSDKQLKLHHLVDLTSNFIKFETNQGEFTRVRQLFKFICKLADPESPTIKPVWDNWKNFELNHGNEATFKEILRFNRSVRIEFEHDSSAKDLVNPMGFIKSSNTDRSVDNITNIKQLESNPDEIDLDMDM